MKKEKSNKQKESTPLIPAKYQHAASMVFIFLSLIIFFHEVVFESKVFVAADTIASKSFETLVSDAEQQGIFPLWNPYTFCGMPGYASLSIHGERYFDVTALAINRLSIFFGHLINNPDVGWGLFYYLILGIGIYWFVYSKVKSKIAALVSGLAVMHSTFVIILIMVGHMTKVPVIAFFPFIFLILENIRQKFSIPQGLILVVLVHLMFLPGHFQIIFYSYLAFGFYYLFFLVRALVKKEEWIGIIRSGVVFSVATGLAFAMTGDQYLSTLEYSKYSMRGADPIVSTSQSQNNGGTNGGLDYDYATQWSFSPGEMTTFVVPSAYGFGWFTYQGVLTQNQEMRLNTYFGNMPFTDAPQYMGIAVLLLAGIGFWRNRKDPFVQYSLAVIIASLLISFGKEFPLFYDLMFNYFPMFNKFRIPSMMLILVQIMVPILAGYGVVAVVNDAKERNVKREKMMTGALAVTGVLLLLSVLAKSLFISLYEVFFSKEAIIQSLSRSYGNNQMVLNELYKVVLDMVSVDISFAILFVGSVLGLAYLFQTGRIRRHLFSVGILAVVLFDLWRVNFKPMETHHHQQAKDFFATPAYVDFLKKDTTLYRTLEFEKGQPPYNNTLAYWRIQSAYGYSGTKMRQIQDMYDVAGIGNPLMWGLMNVKYIISDRADSNEVLLPIFGSGGTYILYNRASLPRTFFVSRYEVAKGLEILNSIKAMKFDPREVGYFMEDPGVTIDPPTSGATVSYTHFGIQDLALNVRATGNNLLFLSETWYPEGWKAFLDGKEIPIYRMNYMFRGVIVPEGEHVVTMKFEPAGFAVGKNLSLWLNILVLGALAFIGVQSIVRKKRQSALSESTPPAGD